MFSLEQSFHLFFSFCEAPLMLDGEPEQGMARVGGLEPPPHVAEKQSCSFPYFDFFFSPESAFFFYGNKLKSAEIIVYLAIDQAHPAAQQVFVVRMLFIFSSLIIMGEIQSVPLQEKKSHFILMSM